MPALQPQLRPALPYTLRSVRRCVLDPTRLRARGRPPTLRTGPPPAHSRSPAPTTPPAPPPTLPRTLLRPERRGRPRRIGHTRRERPGAGRCPSLPAAP